MARTKQTMRTSVPTREEVEEALRQAHAAHQAGYNNKPTPPCDSRDNDALRHAHAARRAEYNRKPTPLYDASDDDGSFASELSGLSSSELVSAQSSAASAISSSHQSGQTSGAFISAALSAQSASAAQVFAPMVCDFCDDAGEEDEQTMYQLHLKHREALQNMEQCYLAMMSHVWSQYIPASMLNGYWPFEEYEKLSMAIVRKKNLLKIVDELKLLGYKDMFDDGYLVHDTFKDIDLGEFDVTVLDNFVVCHLYYTFVIMRRLRKKQKTALTIMERQTERARVDTEHEARNDAVFVSGLGGITKRPPTPEEDWSLGGF